MVGPHDLGGQKGFGAVHVVPGEPPFPAPWHGNVAALTITVMSRGRISVDRWRARQEDLHPLTYYRLPYFERQLYGIERCLVEDGVLDDGEIQQRLEEFAANPDMPMPEYDDPEFNTALDDLLAEGAPIFKELSQAPRFAVGDRVRLRTIEIEHPGKEHTRLPRYAQGKLGEVARLQPAHNLPDQMVATGEERLEHTYAIRLAAADLWPDGDPNATVFFDAWESYLEPAE